MSLKPKFVTKGSAAAKELSKEEAIKRDAERAVEQFKESLDTLNQMKEDFSKDFPEAAQAYEEVLKQEDIVRAHIAAAHALVQQAKESIGPFTCTRKYAAAGYDSEKLTVVLRQLENRGELMQALLDAGVVKEIALAKDATAFFAQNPVYGKLVQPAWQDKQEKTAAVSDPKI